MSLLNPRSETHAVVLLKNDHREVEKLFKEFESAESGDRKIEIVDQVCLALTVHAAIEEQVFYPAALRALDSEEEDQIQEARVEHATLKGLIARLDGLGTGDELFKAYVTVLKEYVQHHVKEEESEMFPKIERTDLDLEEMGQQMLNLKERLTTQARQTGGTRRGMVSVPHLGEQGERGAASGTLRPARTGAMRPRGRGTRKAAARRGAPRGNAGRRRRAKTPRPMRSKARAGRRR